MPKIDIPPAQIVSGDARIATLLDAEGTFVQHAYSCRLDGFVNDSFTEYANPSVYRPASVCRARLVSTIQYGFSQVGDCYLAFTMYATAGVSEPIAVHIGHEQVALAEHPDPDNRLHLFVVPGRRSFIGGEVVRLTTGETAGPCRIEEIVLLKRKPAAASRKLRIESPDVKVLHVSARPTAVVTWTTSRPARGTLQFGPENGKLVTRRLPCPLVNHETELRNLLPNTRYQYSISLQDRTGQLTAAKAGTFTTRVARPRGTVERASIPIRLRRASGFPWPVCVGVPFPRKALGSADHISVRGQGTLVPSQARALSRWPDGSIKWALIDFTADGSQDYTLDYGRSVAPVAAQRPVRVTRSRNGIRVDTGMVRSTFSKSCLALPGSVEVRQADGTYHRISMESGPHAVTLIDDGGRVYTAAKPEVVAVEEAGPMRVCVRVEVRHRAKSGQTLFRSIFRFQFYAGQSRVRCFHTFENDNEETPFTSIRSLALHAAFDPEVSGEVSCEGADAVPMGQSTLRLTQFHDAAWALHRDNRVLRKGARAVGTATLAGDSGCVAFAVRDFWQNYPKAITLDGKGITFDICPELPRDIYPTEGELEDRLFYWYAEGVYRLKRGMAKTHEFWFDFAAADSNRLSDEVQSPPLYCVGLEAFNESGALTQLPGKTPSPYPAYEQWVDAAKKAYEEDRVESRAWGLLNFGDWFGERTYNWGNMEYDTPWCYLQEYLRGGHPDFFVWAEEAARHLVDIDTCHHGEGSAVHNNQYLHSIGHVGDYYPEGYRPRSICGGRTSVSHTWVEGLFLHHALTGEARSLEVAEKVSANLVGEILNDYDFTNCRNSGWHLIHLSAAYRATGRRVFLNAARIIVARVLERQRESGGWDRLMVPGHCLCDPPRHMGNAGFMVGVLMVGLKRYHEATGEKRVAEAIVRAADYCIDRMWVPEASAFHYTCCPQSSVGSGADMRILKGVAAAYGFTGRDRFAKVLLAGVESAMSGNLPRAHRGVGKGICSPMRGALQVLAALPTT